MAVSAKRSASEANGKLLNYMAMGLPTVAYETPVSRELLGEHGVYAPPGDVAALGEALLGLLDDGGRREVLGRALRARALYRFSWDGVGARLESVYESLPREGGLYLRHGICPSRLKNRSPSPSPTR